MSRTDDLRKEALAAQRTALKGRLVALAIIAVLVTVLSPWPAPVFTWGLLCLFALSGWGAWRVAVAAWGRPWHQYAFILADFALLAFTLLYPNPFLFDYPPQIGLRFGNFVYFFVLLTGLAYVFQPRLVLWGGLAGAISWTVGVGAIFVRPDTVWQSGPNPTVAEIVALFGEPTFLDLGVRIQEIVVFLICAGLIALAVQRARAIAIRQSDLARQRANLARYFSRPTADMLAKSMEGRLEPREGRAAVLFADLVSFTAWSERHGSARTIELLREIQSLLTEAVTQHRGVIDKFLGDGLMASFGAHEEQGRSAADAVEAAVAMADRFEDYCARSRRSGELPQLSIGLHFGHVVVGDVGSADRLELAVLGDTVNVASRLEQSTRRLRCHCLVSQAALDAASEQGLAEEIAKRLRGVGNIALRGRDENVPSFAYG